MPCTWKTDLAMSRPIVVIDCMIWLLRIVGLQQAPTFMALTCRWRSRPQLNMRHGTSAIGLFSVVQDGLEDVGAGDHFQKRSCKFSRRFALMSRFSLQSGIIFRTHVEDKLVL